MEILEYFRKHRSSANLEKRIYRYLSIAGSAYLIFFVVYFWRMASGGYGYMFLPGIPFGIDFMNVWGAARLVVSGAVEQIYDPEIFASLQVALAGEEIGLSLWAYPPQSFMFIWPLAFGGYHLMFAIWTSASLIVLGFGARRFGFSWLVTGILVFSPASLQCILLGQTGNIFAGLLLLAFAGTSLRTPSSVIATALLTLKPQVGFLVPVLWLLQRRWSLIFATGGLAIALVLVSVSLFGMSAWSDYLTKTLPALNEIETNGVGNFVYVIPSVFMSLRLLGLDGADARLVHIGFAAVITLVLVWRLRRTGSERRQIALIMVGTCLITPYLHFYDLGILLAGMLIHFRQKCAEKQATLMDGLAIAVAWALPIAMVPLGRAGIPLSPLIILVLFAIIGFRTTKEVVIEGASDARLATP